MDNQKYTLISVVSVVAVILGAVIGYYFPDTFSNDIFGRLLLNGLTILMVPILITVLTNSIIGMGITSKSNRSLYKSLALYGSFTAICAVLGAGVGFLIQPDAQGFADYQATADNSAFAGYLVEVYRGFSFNSVVGSIYSGSFWSDITSGNVLGLVLLVVLFGSVLLKMDKRKTVIIDFFKSAAPALNSVITYLLWFIPIALFFSAASIFSEQAEQAYKLFEFFAPFTFAYVGLAILLAGLVFPLTIKLFAHRNPFEFFRNILPAVATAFITGSKTAAFPVAVNNLAKVDDLDSRATGFALPTGMIFNASGHTIFYALGTIYLLSLWGAEFTVTSIGFIIFSSILLSLVASLMPLGSTVILLSIIMPLAPDPNSAAQGIIFLFIGEWLFNRIAQALNMVGDCTASAVLAETFDFKTARVTHTTSASNHLTQHKPRERKNTRESKPKRKERKTTRKERPQRKERSVAPKKSSSTESTGKETKQRDKKSADKSSRVSVRSKSPDREQKLEQKQQTPAKPRAQEKPKEPTAKNDSFSIPPVPHHFLEKISEDAKKYSNTESEKSSNGNGSSPSKDDSPITQVSGIPEDNKQETKEKSSDQNDRPLAAGMTSEPESDTKRDKEQPDEDLFAKERAKIRAQLDAMSEDKAKAKNKNDEEKNDFATIDFVADKTMSSTDSSDVKESPDSSKEHSKQPASHTESDLQPYEEKSDNNDNIQVPETVPSDNEDEADISYGRKRKSRKSEVDKKESDDEEKSTSDSSDSDTSFGKSSYQKDEMSFGRGRRKK